MVPGFRGLYISRYSLDFINRGDTLEHLEYSVLVHGNHTLLNGKFPKSGGRRVGKNKLLHCRVYQDNFEDSNTPFVAGIITLRASFDFGDLER